MKKPFDPQSSTYVYVIVRGDLPAAAQAVQACHAAMDAVKNSPDISGERLVLLRAKDQMDLMHRASQLDRAGVDFVLFSEPDHDWGATALATRPRPGRINALSRLPLLDFACEDFVCSV